MKFFRALRPWLVLLALAAAVSATLVFNVLRTTNITAGPGQPDGIQPGGDRHNSYAWCQDTMNVSGVDYLYVGSNRDLLRLVALQSGTTDAQLEQVFQGDVSTDNTDFRARIFRSRLDGTGTWEQVYISPTFPSPGTDPLFPLGTPVPFDLGYRGMAVLNGQLYAVTLGTAYSRVLRFPNTGGPPEEVLRIPGGSLRAISAHNNQLVVGTENNLIFSSPNPPIQTPAVLTNPATFVATAGWTPIASNANLGNPAPEDKVGVWEFESAGDILYASLGQAHGGGVTNQGFRLYKGTFAGLGAPGANPAGWVWTALIDEGARYPRGLGNSNNASVSLEMFNGNLYMGVLMDVIDQTAQGTVFENFTPCQIYRMDASGTVEMVIGDPGGLFPNRVGNYQAGFYEAPAAQAALPPPLNTQNFSLQPYLWWMEVHEGKLYVSTFDMAIFLKYISAEMLTIFNVPLDQQASVLNKLNTIQNLNTNPAGFDLYVTSDGVNFTPVTQNGFGDGYNYGGRTLQSTTMGMSVGTANPFYGCQVYRLQTQEVANGGAAGGGNNQPIVNDGGSGASCFVATAAYGTPLAAELNPLRTFRDRFLLTHSPGRAFVNWYYGEGPNWAAYLNDHPALKPWVRLLLYPVVSLAWLLVTGWIGVLLVPLVPGLWWLRRRRRALTSA